MKKQKQPQPAEKSYVFGQAYRDVSNVFEMLWRWGFDSTSVKELFSNGWLFLPSLAAFIIITVFWVILNSLISLLLICVFLIVASIVYIGFAVVAFLDLVYRGIKRISSVCPNCQYGFDLPAYRCPSCGRIHSRLIPSQYGIFKRKCFCGKKLSTTFFNGRQKLQAICPKCGVSLRDGGKHVDICIPVVGGINSGKTCFITMAISQIEQRAADKKEYDFEYISNKLDRYEEYIKIMKQGEYPEATEHAENERNRLIYYQFYLTPKREKVRRLISICDIPGEVYEYSKGEDDDIGRQIGFVYADAFIIIIDPLSITEYKSEIEKTVDLSKYGKSSVDIDKMLSHWVRILKSMCTVYDETKLEADAAVVFTKCDVPGLDEQIGQKAVNDYMNSHHVTKEEASNNLCKAFLRKYNENNFVNNVESKFKSTQYFTCTSLGDINNESFQPEGVEEPILWLMKKIFSNNTYRQRYKET